MDKTDNNEKPVTCAMVLIDREGSILGCHATGMPRDCGYDFPKGIREQGESDFDAAKRELFEETGIMLMELMARYMCGRKVFDLGVHRHNSHKDIHIFLCPVSNFPPISSLFCRSHFELHGKNIPEMDGYRVIGTADRHMFNRVLWGKFGLIDTFNENLAR